MRGTASRLRRSGAMERQRRAALPHGVHELLLVVDAQKLQVDFRILVEEGPRYGGKPLDSDAREGSHAHKAALPIGELAHAGGQGVLVGVDRLHKTEHFAALGSKMHAAVFAQKERQSQLLFQGVHQVADAGLSVAQFLGGGLEAARGAPTVRNASYFWLAIRRLLGCG